MPNPKRSIYAVIFTSKRTSDDEGYAEMAEYMLKSVRKQPGFLGVNSVRDDFLGITVSYWTDLASITAWKKNLEHQEAQRHGKAKWYASYSVQVAKVEREYAFP